MVRVLLQGAHLRAAKHGTLQPGSATLDLCYTVVFSDMLPLTARLACVSHQASLSDDGQFVQVFRGCEIVPVGKHA